jgi:hypothetical protein
MREKIIVAIAALAIWATGAYPPWKLSHPFAAKETGDYEQAGAAVAVADVSNAVGNDWLINEKSLPGRTSFTTLGYGFGYSVDYGRLVVEWAIIAALYYAAIRLVAPATRRRPDAGTGD